MLVTEEKQSALKAEYLEAGQALMDAEHRLNLNDIERGNLEMTVRLCRDVYNKRLTAYAESCGITKLNVTTN